MNGRDVLNHVRGDCVWFHTTPAGRVRSILAEGLRPGSPPTWQSAPEPWIYLSTTPWNDDTEGQVVLAVDLSGFGTDEVGWPFVDGPGSESWEQRWQLRVMRPIDPERIRVVESTGQKHVGERVPW